MLADRRHVGDRWRGRLARRPAASRDWVTAAQRAATPLLSNSGTYSAGTSRRSSGVRDLPVKLGCRSRSSPAERSSTQRSGGWRRARNPSSRARWTGSIETRTRRLPRSPAPTRPHAVAIPSARTIRVASRVYPTRCHPTTHTLGGLGRVRDLLSRTRRPPQRPDAIRWRNCVGKAAHVRRGGPRARPWCLVIRPERSKQRARGRRRSCRLATPAFSVAGTRRGGGEMDAVVKALSSDMDSRCRSTWPRRSRASQRTRVRELRRAGALPRSSRRDEGHGVRSGAG